MYAAGGRLGSEKTQSGYALGGFFSPPHFFVPVEPLCGSFLSGTKKRHIQPGRYVPLFLHLLEMS
jgi:hypothetical protein